MIATIIESKRIDGKPACRLEGQPAGAWLVANSDIDAMLDHIKRALGVGVMEILRAIGLDASAVTRCRQGKQPLADQWVLRLSDYSGIPVSDLRRVACVSPSVRRYMGVEP